MTAYVVVDIDVHDPAGYEEYKKLAPAAVELYGGKYIARAGKTETLEGDWSPSRLVILQFENSEQAKKWLYSDEYREARAMRHKTAYSKRWSLRAFDTIAACLIYVQFWMERKIN